MSRIIDFRSPLVLTGLKGYTGSVMGGDEAGSYVTVRFDTAESADEWHEALCKISDENELHGAAKNGAGSSKGE